MRFFQDSVLASYLKKQDLKTNKSILKDLDQILYSTCLRILKEASVIAASKKRKSVDLETLNEAILLLYGPKFFKGLEDVELSLSQKTFSKMVKEACKVYSCSVTCKRELQIATEGVLQKGFLEPIKYNDFDPTSKTVSFDLHTLKHINNMYVIANVELAAASLIGEAL